MDSQSAFTSWINYWSGDLGNGVMCEYHSDNSNGLIGDAYAFAYESTTYRNKIIYTKEAETLMWEATRLSDGTVMASWQKEGVGSFPGMNRLYSSSIGDNYAPGARGEGYIDNVVFSVPEPATLLLLGLGGLMLRKRKA